MDKLQFSRFVARVNHTLEYVPDEEESELMNLMRESIHGMPRTAEGQWARQLNQLYVFLGPTKTRELLRRARECHVVLDENLKSRDAKRLQEHLNRCLAEFFDEDVAL